MYYLLLLIILIILHQLYLRHLAKEDEKRYKRFDSAKFFFKQAVLYKQDVHYMTHMAGLFWCKVPDKYKAELHTDMFHWALHHQYQGTDWLNWCRILRTQGELPEILTGDAYKFPKFLEYTKYSDTYNTF